LALVNVVGLFSIAAWLQGILWAIPWTLVFAVNPAILLPSFSELPTNLLTLYFLAGVIAWATLNDTERQPGWAKAAAVLLLCLLTLCMAYTRTEIAVTGTVALGVWGAHALLGEDRWNEYGVRARKAVLKPLALLSRRPALIALFCFAGWAISCEGGGGSYR